MLLTAAMDSGGALSYRDLCEMPIDEVISTIRALGYILDDRAQAARREIEITLGRIGRR